MSELATRLKKSQARIAQTVTAFAQDTSSAQRELLEEALAASRAFAERTRSAGSQFFATAHDVQRTAMEDVRDELDAWSQYLGKGLRRPKLPGAAEVAAEVQAPFKRLEESAIRLQRETLMNLQGTLRSASEKVDASLAERLDALPKAKKAGKAKAKKKAKKVKGASSKGPRRAAKPAAPLQGYDTLTAKEIIATLRDLPVSERRAVLAYEKAHKARATVLRAAA